MEDGRTMLKQRLAVSAIMLAALFLCLFWPGAPGLVLFAVLAALATAFGIAEFARLMDRAGLGSFPTLTVCTGVLLVLFVLVFGASEAAWYPAQLVVLTVFFGLAFLRVCGSPDFARGWQRLAVSATGLAMVYGTLGFIPKIYVSSGLQMDGRLLVLFLLAVTKAADVGAYAAGTLTARRKGGNRKLVPRLSPKKSWEGLAGGVLAAAVTGVLLAAVMKGHLQLACEGGFVLVEAAVLGVVFTVLGLGGDLAVSTLKRAAHADDSGRIPGLGGVLDVVDSLIFVAPIFYAYLSMFSVVS